MQVTEGAGNGAPTLALKPMGRVNQSPKQRVPVAPQNGDILTAKKKKKKKKKIKRKAADPYKLVQTAQGTFRTFTVSVLYV